MVRVVRLERTVSWSQTRRDTNFAIPGYSISAIIPRRGRKSKIFLSVVIYVVKAAFMPLSAIGGNPANAGVTRLCGVSPCPVPDTATAHPNHPRYQLRYTRILNDLMGMDPPEATRRRALHTIPVHYNTLAAKREAYSYPFFLCWVRFSLLGKLSPDIIKNENIIYL